MTGIGQRLRQWIPGAGSGVSSTKYELLCDEESQLDHDRSAILSTSTRPKQYGFFSRYHVAVLLLVDLCIVLFLISSLEPLITLLRRNAELFRPQVTLRNVTSSNLWVQPKVPRILHQTTANSTIPAKWIQSQQSCMESYADYEYMLWTDESAGEFLAREYSWFADSWNDYAFPIQRADAIRYFVLYHYGGIYLDMDTYCNQTFPMSEVEAGSSEHIALFKSTLPTGITNDFMLSTARHPAFAAAIAQLPMFYTVTRFWAKLQPYVNIMLSSGPLFLSLVVTDYLLQQPSLPSPTVQVIQPDSLNPYITDLESSTWHRADAHALMWLGKHPWTWFALGAIGVTIGLLIVNSLLLSIFKPTIRHRFLASTKQAKIA